MAAKFSVKQWIAAGSALLLTGTAAITAYAFLGTKPDEKVNKINVGKQEETVQETFTEPATQQQKNTFQKEVCVENTGDVPCFVRVYMDFSDSAVRDKTMLSANGTDYYKWNEYLTKLNPDWTYVSDESDALGGWFYYTKILQKGDSTTLLLKSLKTEYDTIYDISDFQLIVYSETVQTVEIGSGKSYVENEWKTAWKSFLHIPQS